MKYKTSQEQIRKLSNEELSSYTIEFLQVHPNQQLQSLLTRIQNGQSQIRQILVSQLISQHNLLGKFAQTQSASSTVTKGQYLDAVTIEAIKQTYVIEPLEAAIQEFGEEAASSIAYIIRSKAFNMEIDEDKDAVSSSLFGILSRFKRQNNNNDPRQSLVRLADIYTSSYCFEILGKGIFQNIPLDDEAATQSAKAEISKVVEEALDKFIKPNLDVGKVISRLNASGALSQEWSNSLIPSATIIRNEILEHLKTAHRIKQIISGTDDDDAVKLLNIYEEHIEDAKKLLSKAEYRKYFNYKNAENFINTVLGHAQALGLLGDFHRAVYNSTPLHISLLDGNIEKALKLIEHREFVDSTDARKSTALHIACFNNITDAIEPLLNKVKEILPLDFKGNDPLLLASAKGNDKVVEIFLKFLKDKSIITDNGLIHKAIESAFEFEHIKVIECFVKYGYKFLVKSEDAIEYAQKGKTKLLEIAIKHGKINVNQVDNNGWTLLHHASRHGHLETVKLLLELGADIIIKTKDTNSTAQDLAKAYKSKDVENFLDAESKKIPTFHKSILSGNFDEVYQLIKKGSNLNLNDEHGLPPLILACLTRRSEIATLFIIAGAELITTSLYGSPLEIAIASGQVELANNIRTKLGEKLYEAAKKGEIDNVSNLIKNGADVNFQDKDGVTALHMASFYGHAAVTFKLLHEKANPNLTRKDGFTPLHFACLKGNETIVKALIGNGAQLDLKTTNGKTAEGIAEEKKYNNIVQILKNPKDTKKEAESFSNISLSNILLTSLLSSLGRRSENPAQER
jgi:ankyrin repeat protein